MKAPVFILGSHKSGTSLLRSLLDGMPGFFVIPLEVHLFELAGLWIDYAIRRRLPHNRRFSQVLEEVQTNLTRSNEKSGSLARFGGDSAAAHAWNIPAAMDHLAQHGRVPFEAGNLRGFMDALVSAYHLGLTGSLPSEETRFVEKSVENAEFAPLLKKLYPEASFIHILRNPYATLVSIRKFMQQHGAYPYLGTLLDALEHSAYYAVNNPLAVDDYLVLRYEDLVTEPGNCMQQVAGLLKVPYQTEMLKPSVMGQEWQGNSMSGEPMQGVSSQPMERWKGEINPLETTLVNQVLEQMLERFRYEKQQPKGSPWKVNKGERLKKYLANRAFWLSSQVRRTGR